MATDMPGGKREILFVGDSLTAFFDWQKCFPEFEVSNLDLAGETVEELCGRLDEIFSAVAAADFIFLMTGINNVAMEEYDIAEKYREVLKILTSHYADGVIVVQSILPVGLPWVDNKTIRELNGSIEEAAGEAGAEYLDLYTLFADEGDVPVSRCLLDDGVHLSAAGYEIWSAAVGRFLMHAGRK